MRSPAPTHQHDRESHLDHNQRCPNAPMLAPGDSCAASISSEGISYVDASRLPRREQTEEQPHRQTHAERGQEHPLIDADERHAREAARCKAAQDVDADRRHQTPRAAAMPDSSALSTRN